MSAPPEGPGAAAPPAALVWRGVHVVMAAFFLLAAAANVNDDDW